MKVCTYCKLEFPLTSFRKYKKRGHLYTRANCKNCERIKRRAFLRTPAGKLVQRKQDLKKLYGISLEDYNTMLKSQNNVCLICKQIETSKSNGSEAIRTLCVDHNHETGEVRGLLCNNCNKLLGHAKDNIDILQTAIKYLKFYSKSNVDS